MRLVEQQLVRHRPAWLQLVGLVQFVGGWIGVLWIRLLWIARGPGQPAGVGGARGRRQWLVFWVFWVVLFWHFWHFWHFWLGLVFWVFWVFGQFWLVVYRFHRDGRLRDERDDRRRELVHGLGLWKRRRAGA